MLRRYISSPLPLIILLLLVTSIMNGRYDSIGAWFLNTLYMIPGVIIALSFHEFGHAFVAVKCGDPTPRNQGRLTVNPAAHVDPIGLACLVFVGFGWGVPVQINPRNFRHPRRDELLVSLAGVAMNFVLAIVFMAILRLLYSFSATLLFTGVGDIIRMILLYTVQINIVLLVFNLIPVPPLDGF
ncbi:MAG: site-2 protease family protein, partial [Firmicutes bacterium]|nr:site-2 protease family protein [Bacillota bacterium]